MKRVPQNAWARLFTGYSAAYWRAWSAALLFFAAFYTLTIPLPLYLSEIGLPDWQTGMILGALGGAALVARPLAGVLSDRRGRRWVMALGTGMLVFGALGFNLTVHPGLLFALRVCQAAGYAAFTTAATALVADLAPAERRASALAIFGTAANVSMTLVPAAVGSLLAPEGRLEGLSLQGGFWLAAGLGLLGGTVVLFRMQEDGLMQITQRARLSNLVSREIAHQLALPAFAALLFGGGFGLFFQYLPLLAERRALGSAGLVYTVYGAVIILTRLGAGGWLDRARPQRVLALGFALLAGGLGLFALAFARIHLFLGAVGVAAGGGILHPLLIALHVQRVSPQQRGRASAIFYLGFDLGIGLGSWLGAPIFETYGVTGLFMLGVVFALIGLAAAGWLTAPPDES